MSMNSLGFFFYRLNGKWARIAGPRLLSLVLTMVLAMVLATTMLPGLMVVADADESEAVPQEVASDVPSAPVVVTFEVPDDKGGWEIYEELATDVDGYLPAVPELPEPKAFGHRSFLGWTTDSNPTERSLLFAIDRQMSAPYTLRTVFSDKWMVQFLDGFDKIFKTQLVEPGGKATDLVGDPPVGFEYPSNKGYTGRWIIRGGGLGVLGDFDFATPIAAHTVLQPVLVDTCSVSFITFGSPVASLEAVRGERVGNLPLVSPGDPDAPTRAGYTFDGWTQVAGGDGPAIADDYIIEADLYLYARWVAVPPDPPDPSDSPDPPAPSGLPNPPDSSGPSDPPSQSDSPSPSSPSSPPTRSTSSTTLVVAAAYAVSYAPGGDKVVGLPTGATLQVGASYTVAGAAPSREGYLFGGYASSLGGTLQAGAAFTMPARNVTLTATWEEETIAPPKEPEAPSPDASANTHASTFANTSDVRDTPDVPNQIAPIASVARDQGIPVLDILGKPVSLVSPDGYDAWSLFDLICVIAGIFILTFVGIYLLIPQKPQKSKQKDAVVVARLTTKSAAEGVRVDRGGSHFEYDVERTCREARPGFLVATAFATATGVILFMFAQDITLPMVLLDGWNIVFGILLLACIVFARLAFTQSRHPDTPYPEPLPALPAGTPTPGSI